LVKLFEVFFFSLLAAAERHAIEQAVYEEKLAKRAEKERKTGKKSKGKNP